ncbi:uncharacterized protein LOC114933473 isoform X1 [Nylanderia fulva]|uniref:uncharacterized protein LOC114933473 isoform X1 n=1 Tax=Nylanderia fulva TaxID=613905 RepID=UPI0010FAD83E|nr:uncharacterized protein LOC114933473 isoform X1 [Nylanderia fulva]
MKKNVSIILLLTFVLSCAQADEHERRRNTPPELTSGSVVKTSSDEEPQTRLLSFIPVTATVSLNAGRNNAHSVSLGASLDGISLSESNSYNYPTRYGIDGSSVSVSKSTTVAAGLSGISTAGAKAYNDGNNVKTESHSLSFGQASATSFGAVENGHAITGAASSIGGSQFSVETGGNQKQFSQAGAINAQYPYRPAWNNVGPNDGRNDRRFNRPTLTIWKPHDGRRPTLNIDSCTSRREERPTIHIHQWRPDHRIFSRPELSIKHQPRDPWNHQIRGSPSLQVSSSSYGFSGSYDDPVSQDNAGPTSFASSSIDQEYTLGNAQSWESASSNHDSSDSFDEDNSKGTSTSGRQGGNSVTRVNAQAIASSVDGSFVKFPEGGSMLSQIIPLQYVGNRDSEQGQSDSDVLSDLAQTVGELLHVV